MDCRERYILAGMIAALACALLLIMTSSHLDRSQWPERSRMRAIVLAITNYYQECGHVPYSSDGPSSALYLLRELVDESALGRSAKWDHATRTVHSTDVVYANMKGIHAGEERVIAAIAHRQLSHSVVTLGFADGWVTRSGEIGLGPALFGARLASHGMFCADSAALHDWMATHAYGQPISLTSSPSGEVTYIRLLNSPVNCALIRSAGRLRRCEIHTPAGVIHETFQLSDEGVLKKVIRTPANWKEIAQEYIFVDRK